MASINLQDDLNWLLIRSSMTAKHGLMKMSEEYDLTVMQLLTLCVLEPEDSVPMSTISDLLVCDPSSVTGIVDRLSSLSYIERRESSVDRRVKTIRLTTAGIALRQKIILRITEKQPAYAASLTKDEIKTLQSLLVKLLPTTTTKSHQAVQK